MTNNIVTYFQNRGSIDIVKVLKCTRFNFSNCTTNFYKMDVYTGVTWKMDPPLKMEPGSIFNVVLNVESENILDLMTTLHVEYGPR